MSIKISCEICRQELTELGALMFSPPMDQAKTKVLKTHFCTRCHIRILDYVWFLQNLPDGQEPPEMKMTIEGVGILMPKVIDS